MTDQECQGSHRNMNSIVSNQQLQDTLDESCFAPTYASRDLVLESGKGMRLWDQAGRQYLDFGAGIAVSILGHGDSQVTEAISSQASRLLHASNYYHSEPSLRLGHLLTRMSGYPGVFLCNSGTEANEAALKFARAFHYRKKNSALQRIISFENAFHGRTFGSLSATPNTRYREPFEPLLAGFESLPFNDQGALERELQHTDIAAAMVEPVQGEGGVRPGAPGFLRSIGNLCNQTDAVFILDEIQCSLGRLGSDFAFKHFGIAPDIVTIAKPLAAGLPIGAVLVSQKIYDVLEPGDHGTTFGGNPVCAAAANVVLNRLTSDNLSGHVRALEPTFAGVLEDLLRRFPTEFSATRGVGFLRALDTHRPSKEIVDAARQQGLLILSAGANTLRFAPPLIADTEHFQEFSALMSRAIEGLGNLRR